jgi:hypothetical protein
MRRAVLFASLLALAFIGGAQPHTAHAQAPALVRVAHLAPGAPPVDVALDGQVILRSLAFGEVSGYTSISAGTRRARITPAGAREPAVIEAPLSVESGRAYTVVATGELPSLALVVVSDDLALPPAGQAKVRFVHSAPDAPAVDIAVTGDGILFPNIAYRSASTTAAVPVGTYTLEVRPTGQQTAVLSVPNVTLSAGDIITVFAAGKVSDRSLRAVVATYRPTPMMPTTGAGVLGEPVPPLPPLWLAVPAIVLLGALARLPRRVPAFMPVRLAERVRPSREHLNQQSTQDRIEGQP